MMQMKIEKWKLANEIYNVIRVQRQAVDEIMPHLIEEVITYHMQENKNREHCGCVKLDESTSKGWYDGAYCSACGYVRGMYVKPIKEE